MPDTFEQTARDQQNIIKVSNQSAEVSIDKDSQSTIVEVNESCQDEIVEQNIKVTKTTFMPYYRRLDEPIGDSLFQDALNRMKRAQVIKICEEIK